MVRFVSFLIVTLFALTVCAHADTIHVPADQPTIQAGIDAAVNGDTVLVAPGTYVENIDFKGKGILVASSAGPESTVIDGNQDGSVVTFDLDEGPDAVLNGFTVTNGTGTWDPSAHETGGGGVYCRKASPKITNNIITLNTLVDGIGGGIFITDGAPVVMHNIVSHNIGDPVGGIADWSRNLGSVIKYNRICYNSGSYAGGISCGGNSVYEGNIVHDNDGCGLHMSPFYTYTVRYNVIYRNKYSHGGGIQCWHLEALIDGNLICHNFADQGGGIYCNDADILLINNTIACNHITTSGRGGGLYSYDCDLEAVNTIFWGNQANGVPDQIYYSHSIDVTYCDVEGGWPGTGNISEDPLFVDPGKVDFHILYPSACRDAGTEAGPALSDYDFEGDPRRTGVNVDIGADEFHAHLYSAGTPTPGGFVWVSLIGTPGLAPATIWCGSGALADPIPTLFGDWYLELPLWAEIRLVDIPASGLREFPHRLGIDFPAPLDIPMQALIGLNSDSLTNLEILEVR